MLIEELNKIVGIYQEVASVYRRQRSHALAYCISNCGRTTEPQWM